MQARCDTLVNNMSEAFNSVIVDARSKPIITMLEGIRLYIMNRWASNRSKVKKYQGLICPKIRSRLSKEAEYTIGFQGTDTVKFVYYFHILILC